MPAEGRTDLDSAQTLRSMISHSDERFQALSVRIAGLEDYLSGISSSLRLLREAAGSGSPAQPSADPFAEADPSRGQAVSDGISELNQRLDEIETHLAAAFQHLADRDQALVAAVADEVRGDATTTQDRLEALEGHVREGSLAMGSLVSAVQDEVRALSGLAEREIAVDPARISADIERALDDRIQRLAALIRSDSSRLAELVQSNGGAEGGWAGSEELARILDSRIGRMSELVSATTMSAVGEVARKVPEETVTAVTERFEEMTMAVDRDFVALTDTIDAQLRRMGNTIAEQVTEAADAALAQRLNGAASASGAPAVSGASAAELQEIMDQRLASLAKLIRSDNKAIASVVEIAAQQEAAKQAARSVKEMHASLPAELMEAIDRRFEAFADSMHRETQATVEALAKTAEVLAERFDQTTASLDERYDRDMRAVNDRLGRVVEAIVNQPRGEDF